jgi:ATPase family AAA domain-containing protein 3A/B
MFNFGGSSKQPEDSGSKKAPAEKPQSNNSRSGGDGLNLFDSSALERAAKAAKQLEGSKHSADAVNLSRQQEITKQKEAESERAKFMAMQQELAIKRVHEEEEAAKRTLQNKSQYDKERAEYGDQLERKRMIDQINAQRHLQEEERAKQEESLKRQEAIRRKTLEYEAELRQQTETARVKAETEGRIVHERKNHDLALEKARLEAAEQRETALESIKLATERIGEGLNAFVGDRTKLGNTAATLSLIAVGVYGSKNFLGVAARFVEARLGKPSLVRETTRKNAVQMIKSPIASFKHVFGSGESSAALKNIVLPGTLTGRLTRVAESTVNTKANNAPFRHLLLHGPPGTGKTMFAKGLARESGLHYAIMTGGDVAPLGKDAVTEIHKIFDWAQTTRKGVLLFVDEADAFLRKRSTEHLSEDMRNALNAFLYRTGEASNKFMIVYASNQPEQFDWAINDRIDEMVEFNLPGYGERVKMIVQYISMYLSNPAKGGKPIQVDSDIDEECIVSVAKDTQGFSGREISKLAIAWQAAAYGTKRATIDKELFLQVLEEMKESKKMKQSWLTTAEAERMTSDSKN